MLYLSQAIGRPVLDVNGESIGKVDDLIVALGDRYPPVTGLVVATDRRRIFLPWSHVASFDGTGARLSTGHDRHHEVPAAPRRDPAARADLLDKQIVDIDGRKVVRVNDLRLDDIEGQLHLVAVDVGRRRPAAAARDRGRLSRSWPAICACRRPSGTSTGRTSTRSRSTSRRSSCASRTPASASSIRRTSPTIIDQLTPRDRAGVLAALDDEAAADAIEEMEPETQVEVLEDLAPERAADILEEMSPDDAADLVADLDQTTRDEILALMERDEAEEVQELLGYPGGLGRRDHDHRVHRRSDEHSPPPSHRPPARARARRRDDLLRLRDRRRRPPHRRAVAARPDRRAAGRRPIREVMIREPVAVGVLADQDEVAEVVAHYNLLAVPVVDDDGRLVGIVTVDDAIDTVIPTAWKKRLPRVFSR